MTRKSIALVSIVALLAAAYFLIASFHDDPVCPEECGEQLAGDIAEQLSRKGSVRLAKYTPFEWDEVFQFAPYTPIETILDVTSARKESERLLQREGMDVNELHSYLVFLQGNRVVHVQPVPPLPLGQGDKKRSASEEEAVLTKSGLIAAAGD